MKRTGRKSPVCGNGKETAWEIFREPGRTYPAICFQLFVRCSAVRQANA